jgi:hypothetical protein
VTLVLRHNQALELNRAEYHGSVSPAELVALAEFQASNPTWLTYDSLSWITPGADFDDVDLQALDAVFDRYRQLFRPHQLMIFRRSAWLCQSPGAQRHLDHWLHGHDTRAGMSSDLRQFDTFKDAGAWLVLSKDETAALESGEGFNEIVRYSISARGFAR